MTRKPGGKPLRVFLWIQIHDFHRDLCQEVFGAGRVLRVLLPKFCRELSPNRPTSRVDRPFLPRGHSKASLADTGPEAYAGPTSPLEAYGPCFAGSNVLRERPFAGTDLPKGRLGLLPTGRNLVRPHGPVPSLFSVAPDGAWSESRPERLSAACCRQLGQFLSRRDNTLATNLL